MGNTSIGTGQYRPLGPQNNFQDKQVNLRASKAKDAPANVNTQEEFTQDLQGAVNQAQQDGDQFISLGQFGDTQVRMTLNEANQLLTDLRQNALDGRGFELSPSSQLKDMVFANLKQDHLDEAFEGVAYVSYTEASPDDQGVKVGHANANHMDVTGTGRQGFQGINPTLMGHASDSGINYTSTDVQLENSQISVENGRQVVDMALCLDGEEVNYQIVSSDNADPFNVEKTKIYAGKGNEIHEVVKPDERAAILRQVDAVMPQNATVPRIGNQINLNQNQFQTLVTNRLDKVNSGVQNSAEHHNTLTLHKTGDLYHLSAPRGNLPAVNLQVNANPKNGQIQNAFLMVGNQSVQIPQNILMDVPGGQNGVISLNNQGEIQAIRIEGFLPQLINLSNP